MNPSIIVAKCMTLSWKQQLQFYGETSANTNYNLSYRSSHFNYTTIVIYSSLMPVAAYWTNFLNWITFIYLVAKKISLWKTILGVLITRLEMIKIQEKGSIINITKDTISQLRF